MQLNFSMTHLIYRLSAIFVLITMRKIANRITNDNDKKGTAGEIGAMLFHVGLISICSVYLNPTHLSIVLIKLELIRELINSLINMEHHGSSIKSPKFASMLTLKVLFKCHFFKEHNFSIWLK